MRLHWEDVQRLAKAHHCEDPVANVETFERFLRFWWCRTYSRPLKDPVLQSYTLDELTYEYLRHLYHEPDMDPRKEMQAKEVKAEDDQWIQEMMKKVKEQQKPATPPEPPPKAEEKATFTQPTGEPEKLPEAFSLPEISTKFED